MEEGDREMGDKGTGGGGKMGIEEWGIWGIRKKSLGGGGGRGEIMEERLQNEETLRGSEKRYSQERRSRLQGMCSV
jgi:hypothetical protein